jgi:hypothetical protein
MSAEQKPLQEFEQTQEGLETPELEPAVDEGILEPNEEPAAPNEANENLKSDEGTGHHSERRSRRERGRDAVRGRGGVPALPLEPETETTAPETVTPEVPKAPEPAEEPVVTAEPQRIYNLSTVPEDTERKILGASRTEAEPQTDNQNQDAINQAIAEYTQKHNTPAADPTERPDTSGAQQSYRVALGPDSQRNLEAPLSRPEHKPETVTPEVPKAPEPAEEPVVTAEPAAPVAPARRRAAPSNSDDLYSQLGLAENPLATDRDQLRGASRTGLETTGAPILNSREIRDQNIPEPGKAANATSPETTETEPAEAPRVRRRHRREDPASFAERVLGYTTARSAAEVAPNPDNEATQQIPVINPGEANTGETAPRLSRMQRLRAKLGSMASSFTDLSENFQQNREIHHSGAIIPADQRPGVQSGMNRAERRLEKRRQEVEADADSEQSLGVPFARFMTSEENAQHERGRGARRRRMVGALGLAAASVGLMAGVSGDISRDEAPRSSISANQLPSQQQGQQERISTIFDNQIDKIQEGLDRQVESLEKGGKQGDTSNEQAGKTVDVGNEKITLDHDGSVTIKLEKGGNYWEGVHEAERLLDIDDSATATANAVNTIGFEEGEDRNQKVGAKVTFKNIDGKLVASRS